MFLYFIGKKTATREREGTEVEELRSEREGQYIKKLANTRMHSSRMRTGRALTVSGGGVHPRRNFGGKN